jgi:HD-GYP domain-containing protein (c-di-GMP phosphodiesterase class II)
LRRAGFVHDIGRVAISAAIWGKEGPLTNAEWERVRLHPYYTERVLAQSKALAPLGQLAALHHERLDGSGYHRGVPGSFQNASARVLAATDVFHAMLEPRPHRPAFSPEQATSNLELEVREGRLDRDAVNAVLAAAGQKPRRARRTWPEGLSEREVEVLRLIARGLANRQMADRLGISKVTVGHHVQHIYDKIGVSTRAGATLFAMQHDLLEK